RWIGVRHRARSDGRRSVRFTRSPQPVMLHHAVRAHFVTQVLASGGAGCDGSQHLLRRLRSGTRPAPHAERGERTTMEDVTGFDTPVRDRGPHPGRPVWASRGLVPILASVLVLGVGLAQAADNPIRGTRESHTITVIDPALLLPGALTLGQGEVLE